MEYESVLDKEAYWQRSRWNQTEFNDLVWRDPEGTREDGEAYLRGELLRTFWWWNDKREGW